MTATLQVRRAGPADAAAVAAVHIASWRAAYKGLITAETLDALDVGRFTDQWRVWLEPSPRERTVVAVVGPRVVGFASSGPLAGSDGGELRAIYAAPEVWGTGAGLQVHDAALDALRADGHTTAELWVLAENDRAIRFYERHQWAPTGVSRVSLALDVIPQVIVEYRRDI